MSYRIELKDNLVIVQLVTPKGKTFRLIKERENQESTLLDEQYDAEDILHSAEQFQNYLHV